ncbi:MAG TPA: polyprenyl synthetase family protein [Dictyobacter sp.]|jgi:geranylgeranyl diphosphate synthase type I|nr:polyprenyl synthetase family protein [Dictyobacter sp.]
MALSTAIQSTLSRHQHYIDMALRATLRNIIQTSTVSELNAYYGQMQYHLGWVDSNFTPIHNNPGKMIRPTLLLFSYEAAGAWGQLDDASTDDPTYLQRALPAAVAVELTHNFTLIHDDIEDGDIERRHRPTAWKVWGLPQALNTGDGMFALSRSALWGVLEKGVDGLTAAHLAQTLDQSVQTIAEGQYLDLSFESRFDISVSMYLDMIKRKTAVLMGCATKMGAMLGTHDEQIIERLHLFGDAIGIAFQVRDDMLGIWATEAELGKTSSGDVYRRKKSLPILHALEHASTADQQTLTTIYQQTEELTPSQVEQVLAIFERTQTRDYCRAFLRQQGKLAQEALAMVPRTANTIATRALDDMQLLIQYIADAAK